MAQWTTAKKPSSYMMANKGELTTAQIARPAPLPWPMPATGTPHVSQLAYLVESP